MRYYSESGLPLRRGTKYSAGLDLPFYDPDNETCTINPGQVMKVPTGVYLEPTPGVVAFLDSRSSTSKLKLDLMCRTIDWDYRGQVFMVFINHGDAPVIINRGDYLAQVIEMTCFMGDPVQVGDRGYLSHTGRGDGGFGSTDKK